MADLKEKIIKASLLHIRSYGFSERAIIEGCHFLGLSSASKGLIPNKELSLVHHVLDQAYEKSLLVMKSRPSVEGSRLDTSKVGHCIGEYIMNLGMYAEFWDEAMLVLGRPNNMWSSLEKLRAFSQEIHAEALGLKGNVSDSPIGMRRRFFFNSLRLYKGLVDAEKYCPACLAFGNSSFD